MGNFSAYSVKSGVDDSGRNPTFKKTAPNPAQGAFVELNGVRVPYKEAVAAESRGLDPLAVQLEQLANNPHGAAVGVGSPTLTGFQALVQRNQASNGGGADVQDLAAADQRVDQLVALDAQTQIDRYNNLTAAQAARRAGFAPFADLEQRTRVAEHIAQITGKPIDKAAADKVKQERDALGSKIDAAVKKEFDNNVNTKVADAQRSRELKRAQGDAEQLHQRVFAKEHKELPTGVRKVVDDASELRGDTSPKGKALLQTKEGQKTPEMRLSLNGNLQANGFAKFTPEVLGSSEQLTVLPNQYGQTLRNRYGWAAGDSNQAVEELKRAMGSIGRDVQATIVHKDSYAQYKTKIKAANAALPTADASGHIKPTPQEVPMSERAYNNLAASERASVAEHAAALALPQAGIRYLTKRMPVDKTTSKVSRKLVKELAASGDLAPALAKFALGKVAAADLTALEAQLVQAVSQQPELVGVFHISTTQIRAQFSKARAELVARQQRADTATLESKLRASALDAYGKGTGVNSLAAGAARAKATQERLAQLLRQGDF